MKLRIFCCRIESYSTTIEVPNREAAREFHNNSDISSHWSPLYPTDIIFEEDATRELPETESVNWTMNEKGEITPCSGS